MKAVNPCCRCSMRPGRTSCAALSLPITRELQLKTRRSATCHDRPEANSVSQDTGLSSGTGVAFGMNEVLMVCLFVIFVLSCVWRK